jgi:hypothetical protein
LRNAVTDANSNSYSHCNGNSYGHSNSYGCGFGNANGYCNSYSDGYCDSYCDGNSYCNGHSDADRDAEDDANTTASPNAAAKAIGELIIATNTLILAAGVDRPRLFVFGSECAAGCARRCLGKPSSCGSRDGVAASSERTAATALGLSNTRIAFPLNLCHFARQNIGFKGPKAANGRFPCLEGDLVVTGC